MPAERDIVDYDATGIEELRSRIPQVNCRAVIREHFGESIRGFNVMSYLGINEISVPDKSKGYVIFRPVSSCPDPIVHLVESLDNMPSHRILTGVFKDPEKKIAGYAWRSAA
jgi:hypothetical protein